MKWLKISNLHDSIEDEKTPIWQQGDEINQGINSYYDEVIKKVTATKAPSKAAGTQHSSTKREGSNRTIRRTDAHAGRYFKCKK